MATVCSKRSTMKKQFVRQNALNHDPQCQETQNQVQGLTAAPEESQSVKLSPTKITSIDKEKLLNYFNKELKCYGNHLLRTRNDKKFDLSPENSLKRKKDFSDGLPVSSEVLTETSSLRNNKEDLTDEHKLTQRPNGHGLLDVPQEFKKSPRGTSLDSSSGDEGFVNGDVRKCSLSSALNNIPEDGACAVPTVKVNDGKICISLTGQEKSEGFRSLKTSSGYGTGGSEEAPEDEYPSVFGRSLSNNDIKPNSETEYCLSSKPLTDSGGLVTELSEEALDQTASSTNGQRTVELKESSLPITAQIWKCEPTLNINPDVRKKYGGEINSQLSRSELAKDLLEIMRNNPQIPLPNMSDSLKRDSVADIYRGTECSDEEIGPLISSDLNELEENVQLFMSEQSVPTSESNRIRPDRQVNGCSYDSDAVDGERCLMNKKLPFEWLERAVFCKNRIGNCSDLMCLRGQIHILQLEILIQRESLLDCNPKVLEFLWSHSKKCTECQCVVPLCDSFHRRPSLSLDEHKQLMTRPCFDLPTNELADSMKDVLQNGTFRIVDDERSAIWKTAVVEYFKHMGDFCDANILHVCMRFRQQLDASGRVHVVIKKALQTGKKEKNVYLAIKEPSPYLVKSLWYSNELPDDTLLVCSLYTDLTNLTSLVDHGLTLDRCLAILRQAAEAAQYLHSLNVVYLSWKCSSLLCDKENVKLCNFSHAMVLEQGVVVTSTSNVRSSIDPCFAAPEVLCDGEALGFYSDVWGLGCLLYEMLYRSKPYPLDCCHRSPADIRQMVCQNKFELNYPSEQLDIFVNCWERETAKRITTGDLLELITGSTNVDR